MTYRLSTLFIFCMLAFVGTEAVAQKTLPWKKRLKMAEDFKKNGDYYQAAVFYEGIYKEKPDKDLYVYEAGNCYYLLRDYANAVKCLNDVKDKNATYEKPGYKYALALKQTGDYTAAKKAFTSFLSSYIDTDKPAVKQAVETEIQGCDFALNAKSFTNDDVSVSHLDAKINTNKTEFAPIPFNDDVLYFSSTISGVAKIYRSQKSGDNWSRPQTPNIFVGKMERPHFGNGTFTEDGKRFYFTQCDLEDGKANCAIYVMTESAAGWSEPTVLPDYINAEGSNTTHPHVVVQGDKEVLYFTSDREGGRGGLDIWFCTKNADASSNNYTLPKNLGRNINTMGDDITPFYDKAEGVLYFSSNGRVSAGGLDVFKSKGEKLQWEVAQNLGFPINSAADDLYYTVNASHGGGYFVSNRILAPQKVATTDDDVFYYGEQKIRVTIGGLITDANKPAAGALEDVNVKLFLDDELVQEKMLSDGKYKFILKPKKQYTIEFSKEDYLVASFDIDTEEFTENEDVLKDVGLEQEKAVAAVTEPEEEDLQYMIVPAEYNSKDNPFLMPESPINDMTGEEYVGELLDMYNDIMENVANLSPTQMVYYDGEGGDLIPYFQEEIVDNGGTEEPVDVVEPENVVAVVPREFSTEEAPLGTVYRIQVAAVRRYKAYKYEQLNEAGQEFHENIDGGIKRIMVVPVEVAEGEVEGFKSKGAALNQLAYILNNTRFDRAFVIKYVDGERVGEGFRGLDENEGLDNNDGSSLKEDYNGY